MLTPHQMEESREVNSAFPDALKEPILRRIQFSTVLRVDNLGTYTSVNAFDEVLRLTCALLVDEVYEVATEL